MQYIRTARAAELNAALRMRELGFVDARAVPLGPDGGIDVVARDAVAQVKWRSELAGRPQLQQLLGARAGDIHKKMLFFVTSGYSDHALEFAATTGMCLFTFDPTGSISPVNWFARELVLRSTQKSRPSPPPLPESRQDIGTWLRESIKHELSSGWPQEPKSIKKVRLWARGRSNKQEKDG